MGRHTELIFVEGDSSDGTAEEIERVIAANPGAGHQARAPGRRGRQGGRGPQGLRRGPGDVLMILDADLTVPPEDLPKFLRVLASGRGEFVNGCRLVYPMEKQAMRFLNVLGNKFFSMAFT